MRSAVLIAICVAVAYCRVQNITVKGTTICDKKRVADVRVELMEHDSITFDDKLAEGKSDGNGDFHLSGSDKEMTAIRPYLYVYHTCNRKLKDGCTMRTKFDIPSQYIDSVYDMTYVALNVVQAEEKQVC